MDTQNLSDDLLDFNEEKPPPKDLDAALKTKDRNRIGVCIDEIVSQNRYLTESNANLKMEIENLKGKFKPKSNTNKNQQNQQQQQQYGQNAESDCRSDIIIESSTINKKKVNLTDFLTF